MARVPAALAISTTEGGLTFADAGGKGASSSHPAGEVRPDTPGSDDATYAVDGQGDGDADFDGDDERGLGSDGDESNPEGDTDSETFVTMDSELRMDMADQGYIPTDVIELAAEIPRFTVLRAINLSKNPFIDLSTELVDYSALSALCNAIVQHGQITEVNLADIQLAARNQDGFLIISELMVEAPSVEDLDLSSNFLLGKKGNRLLGISSLMKALPQTGLKRIRLRDNGIHCEALKVIAQGLVDSGKLQVVDLSQNAITFDYAGAYNPRSMMDMCNVSLAQQEVLRDLRLRDCRLSDQDIAMLGETLTNVIKLKTLDIGQNHASVGAARALGVALQTHETLTQLLIDGNELGNRGVGDLVAGLGGNSVLKTLDVTNNGLNDHCTQPLVNALKQHEQLMHFHFQEGHHFRKRNAAAIEAEIIANHLLVQIVEAPMDIDGTALKQPVIEALARKIPTVPSEHLFVLSKNTSIMAIDALMFPTTIHAAPSRKALVGQVRQKSQFAERLQHSKLMDKKIVAARRLTNAILKWYWELRRQRQEAAEREARDREAERIRLIELRKLEAAELEKAAREGKPVTREQIEAAHAAVAAASEGTPTEDGSAVSLPVSGSGSAAAGSHSGGGEAPHPQAGADGSAGCRSGSGSGSGSRSGNAATKNSSEPRVSLTGVPQELTPDVAVQVRSDLDAETNMERSNAARQGAGGDDEPSPGLNQASFDSGGVSALTGIGDNEGSIMSDFGSQGVQQRSAPPPTEAPERRPAPPPTSV